MLYKGEINVNKEINKEVLNIEGDILEIKEEILKLSNLISDIIKELKNNSSMKIEDKESREIENILSNCLDDF